MTEQALKDYFEGKLSVGDLSRDVHGSQIRTGQDTTSVRVIQLTGEEEFKVTRVHMPVSYTHLTLPTSDLV